MTSRFLAFQKKQNTRHNLRVVGCLLLELLFSLFQLLKGYLDGLWEVKMSVSPSWFEKKKICQKNWSYFRWITKNCRKFRLFPKRSKWENQTFTTFPQKKQEIPGPEIPRLWHSRERPSHGFFDHFGGPWVTNKNRSAAAWFNQKMDGTCDETWLKGTSGDMAVPTLTQNKS